jgi:DDE family transposase
LPKKHNRRDGYWKVYHQAHTHELDALVSGIVSLVKENEPPSKVKRTRRGRKPVHSWEKLVCVCLLMIILGYTFRDMQNEVPNLNLPWNEPYPDHSTIHRAYQQIPQEYLDALLERTALLCIEESGWSKGVLASDSSGVETDRYHTVVKPNRKKRTFEEVRQRTFLKYHIVAILDHLIILRARVTSYRVHDSPVLRSMLKRFHSFPGSIFNADRGFDAEANFKRLHQLLMRANIKQIARQKGPKGKGRKRLHYRSRAAKEFDQTIYRWRGMIEAIFGAEESDGHNLRTRFRKDENRERWGPIMAIGWNLKILNRLRWTRTLGIEVTSIIRN